MTYVDAKVAAALLKCGLVKYVLKGGSVWSDDWLKKYSVTSILKVYGKEVALILSLPLLWYFLHETK